MSLSRRLDAALHALPRAYPGPGGACAVLRDGAILEQRTWGYANAERRTRFTPATLFRLCSITKQFTCALLLDQLPTGTEQLDPLIRSRLPRLEGPVPSALHLAHNQSGLRDYWAVAMLHGSPAEADFGDRAAARVIGGTRTLHFAPGTRFSYVNQNFRLLSDALQERAGRPFAELLRRRLFEPFGMGSALLGADTRALPDGTEGYEGSQESGFRPAINRVLWTGDAGLVASLDDMIAWERQIDRSAGDPHSLYARLAAPVRFADGAPAAYGFGLHRRAELGEQVVGHGGALRGWRSHRLHVAAHRLSVVVMFNHMADAAAAASDLLAAVLDRMPPAPSPSLPAPSWLGTWREPETGLAARIDPAGPGRVRLRFGHGAERLLLQPDGSAGARGGTRLVPVAGGLAMERPAENLRTMLEPWPAALAGPIDGVYRQPELGAELTLADGPGGPYGACSGMLGDGRMERLDPIAPDVWAFPCPRALDHTPPGDWTLALERGEDGRVAAVTLGCWLARGLRYVRAG